MLGGAGEVLDLGRASRLATPAQRKALIERDGGCAFCGLEPSMCEVHHVRYWTRDAGPTDLSNLILLCTTCHHRIHDDEWQIRIVPPDTADPYQGPARPARFSVLDEVWFIPPASVYPDRTPRLGGRRRYAPKVRQRC
ncbi:HNH endonuclease [Gulosibacter faecalis]|uniref:HNH endonuclease n=1 Tax=Gulosibacter faecalis TaxID=272240 RepID=A0ABW5UZ49_9MICO